MSQDVYDWILLLGRWIHITTAVTWIGTSIFFMWLDRTINQDGDLWMVHGGGFYHVKKSLMGTTKVPEELHWFKWESYWTWMSGIFLILLVFYTGNGSALLDTSVSKISFAQGILISLLALVISWFFYDFLWERAFTKTKPALGHALTLAWLGGMSYLLCHTLSGRAAYLHIGAMLGTWMTANVFLRIIPRQIKMVEAAKRGEAVNQEWAKNAKNRSTHNTYFTLPVIFLMMSNHFPSTYGNELNWLILLFMCAGGAAVREFFVARLKNPRRSKVAGAFGVLFVLGAFLLAKEPSLPTTTVKPPESPYQNAISAPPADTSAATPVETSPKGHIKGVVKFEGAVPANEKLSLPPGCTKKRGDVFSNAVLVKNGLVQDVAVRITKGLEGKSFGPAPAESVKLDQRDCMYSPRTIAVRTGQPVEFINSDPVFHNVRSVTEKNETFNVAMPQKDQRLTKTFNTPEIMQTKCSVHPWMNSNIVVMEHPYFATTSESGDFWIHDVPAGTYTLEAWHEVFGTQSQEIVVKENETSNLEFIYRK
jgi:uncharacterized membrane protein/plastocyanin